MYGGGAAGWARVRSARGRGVEFERKVDTEARLVVLEVVGDLGDRDLLALADELEGAPEVERDYSLLIDLREARGKSVTTAGVTALATRSLVLSPQSRRAVVVPSQLGFGMARMYGLLREQRGGAARVFLDYAEARRWVETGEE